jgi:NTP pyrophosphatase (non-canonical NTP hydrolase)
MTPRRITLSLSSLQEAAHRTAVEKGWWDDVEDKSIYFDEVDGEYKRQRSLPEQFMLMVSELSEALEEVRKPNARAFYLGENDKPEGWAVELADCVIRIMDTCEQYNQDLQALVEMKMKYNETRPYKHGKVL